MSLVQDLDNNPNTSAVIMILLKKLGGKVEITKDDILSIQVPAKWCVYEKEDGTFILELK
jgi:hypothetical protein